MTGPAEQQPSPEEFQDPLENYDPKTYDDPLEEALAEETIGAIQSTPFATASASATVREAIARLAKQHVACLLIEEDNKLVGVFSDRDVLDKVALEYDEVIDRPVSEVMTREPIFAFDSDFSGAVLSVMAISGYRHVPVLSSDKAIVGIVSPQRVTSFLRQFFDDE